MNRRFVPLFAFVVGCVTAAAAFVGSVALMSGTAHCPPESVCDAPVYVGIGLGILLGPAIGFGTVWLTFRLMTQSHGRHDRGAA